MRPVRSVEEAVRRTRNALREPWQGWRQTAQSLHDELWAKKAPLEVITSKERFFTITEKLAKSWRDDSDNFLGNTVISPYVVQERLNRGAPVEDCEGIAAYLCTLIDQQEQLRKIVLLEEAYRKYSTVCLSVAFWLQTERGDTREINLSKLDKVFLCGHAYCEVIKRDKKVYNIGNWSRGGFRGPYESRRDSAADFCGKRGVLVGHGTYTFDSYRVISNSICL